MITQLSQTRRPLGVAKILGLATAVMFMASCQEEGASDSSNVEFTKSAVIINNNSAELSQRVTMYGNKKSAPAETRSTGEGITMPEAPENPQYDLIMDANYKSWQVQDKKNYLLPEGTVLATDVQFRNNVYYIAGELTINGFWGQGSLVVLPGGKVNYPSHMPVHQLNILSYGDFNITGENSFNLNSGSTFMTTGDLCHPQVLIGGTLYVGEGLSASKVEVREHAVCQVDCSIHADEYLILHNYADLTVGSYLESPKVEMNSASVLQITAGSLVSTQALYLKNPCTVTVKGGDLEYAVLAADKIELNQSNVKEIFTGWMDIHYNEIDNRSGSELEWLSSIKLNGDTYLPAEGCHPEFGELPEVETEPVVGLEHIAQVVTPDHGHYISSTCIQTVADKAYVSYHTRGEDYHGCIEVMNVSEGMCSILSYMEHPTLDFNHLIVDDSRIIAAGGEPKNGAFLGVINLGNGIFQTDAAELTQIELEGASASCVIRNGAYLHATTNEGYHTLDANSFSTMASIATPGSSKFVSSDGTNMGVVSLTDKDTEQSLAVLNMYSASDYTFSNPTQTITLDTIAPINGKNVLHIEGNDAYACLGKNGLKRYTDGVEVAEFKVSGDTIAAANGLAVDEKYVYAAYGHGGLFVLNKADLSVVASYRHSGGKSANYVTVSGDILYVAYGLSGVQIFRLIEK